MASDFRNRVDWYQTNPAFNPFYSSTLYQAPPGIKFRNFRNALSTYLLTWGKNLGQVENSNNGLGAGGNWGQTTLALNIYGNTPTINGNILVDIDFYPNINNVYNWNIRTNILTTGTANVNVLSGLNISANADFPINANDLTLYNANAFPTPTTLEFNSNPVDNIPNPKITDLNYCLIEYRVTSANTITQAFIRTSNMRYNDNPITVLGQSTYNHTNFPPSTSSQNFYYLPINTISGNVNIKFNLQTDIQGNYSTSFEGNRIQIYFGIATPQFNFICVDKDTDILMGDNTIKKIANITKNDIVSTKNGNDYVLFNLDRNLNNKKIRMVCFQKDSIDTNIPYCDTYTTTGHYVLNGNICNKAINFVNGNNINIVYRRPQQINSLVLINSDNYYYTNGMLSKSHQIKYKKNSKNIINANNFYTDINIIRKSLY